MTQRLSLCVACSRRLDRGEGATKCEKKTKQKRGDGVRREGEVPSSLPLPLSPSSSLFFSRSLTSRRAPPSERL